MTTNDYDLLIIGGGLVGASLACALAGQNLRIGLVEAAPLKVSEHPSYDDRTLALAPGYPAYFPNPGAVGNPGTDRHADPANPHFRTRRSGFRASR